MEYLLIGIFSFGAALITFYTGFGLGTILMPIMAIFFPLPLAISITAVVHLFHSLLRTALLWSKINWKIAFRFGGPAVLAAIPGALLLQKLSSLRPIAIYAWGKISWLHLLIGSCLILLGTMEIRKKGFGKKYLFYGGLLSGFFGGFTGNQGAFRSAFLMRFDLGKEAFVGTSALISIIVDLVRLAFYGIAFKSLVTGANFLPLAVAVVSALIAVGFGMIWLQKVTFKLIQKCVIILLYVLGILIALAPEYEYLWGSG